jgi:hypothetical protein
MTPSPRGYRFCGLTIVSDLALPQLRRCPPELAECAIVLEPRASSPAEMTWFHEWRLPGGPVWLSIGRVAGGYLLRFRDLADFHVAADGRRVLIHPEAALPEETLRHLLIDQVLPLVLSRRGRLSLHASAVHLTGIGAVGFVGQTGRGKSTLAAALARRGGRILTDDCLAVDFVDGVAIAVPGYPGLRLWPEPGAHPGLRAAHRRPVAHYSRKERIDRRALAFHGRPSPLRALFLLSPRARSGRALSIGKCGARARLVGLLRLAHVLDVEDRQGWAGTFAGLATLSTSVPVLRLRLRHGHSRLPQAADLLRVHVAALGPAFGGMLTS